ncbi:DUF881 domain-containing protein [Alicyclobacillus herbarius]|uniref:DUF881 domain-containing protein n=1 Tax=Alicyclobacillus herbarius TaxID=122960 RepID=UPI0004012AC7|nr:DUF881 domain-containing protein [Alicyclobacillus herbarius]
MKRPGFVASLTVVSTLIGLMLSLQITARSNATSGTANTSSSSLDLQEELLEQNQEHKLLLQQIEKAEKQLLTFETSGSSYTDRKKALEKDAAQLEAAAGITPVTGPGIIITVQADPTLPGYDPHTVFDPQLNLTPVINYLFAQGATAISINGYRFVGTSSLRDVGDAQNPVLQVNGHSVAPPYVIKAIGDVSAMKAVLTANGFQQNFNEIGEDFEVESMSELTVPGYHDVLPGRYAKEATQ